MKDDTVTWWNCKRTLILCISSPRFHVIHKLFLSPLGQYQEGEEINVQGIFPSWKHYLSPSYTHDSVLKTLRTATELQAIHNPDDLGLNLSIFWYLQLCPEICVWDFPIATFSSWCHGTEWEEIIWRISLFTFCLFCYLSYWDGISNSNDTISRADSSGKVHSFYGELRKREHCSPCLVLLAQSLRRDCVPQPKCIQFQAPDSTLRFYFFATHTPFRTVLRSPSHRWKRWT